MNKEHIISRNDVLDWVKNSLLDSLALTFSNFVAGSVDWENARFKVFAKHDLLDTAIMDFKSGGKTQDGPNPDEWLKATLNSLIDCRDGFLIVEDWLARRQDLFLVNRSMPAFFNGNEVYYLVDENLAEVKNWKRICSNNVPLFHAFFVHGKDYPQLNESVELDKFELIAKCVKLIVFGVYDGESYLVCSFE